MITRAVYKPADYSPSLCDELPEFEADTLDFSFETRQQVARSLLLQEEESRFPTAPDDWDEIEVGADASHEIEIVETPCGDHDREARTRNAVSQAVDGIRHTVEICTPDEGWVRVEYTWPPALFRWR